MTVPARRARAARRRGVTDDRRQRQRADLRVRSPRASCASARHAPVPARSWSPRVPCSCSWACSSESGPASCSSACCGTGLPVSSRFAGARRPLVDWVRPLAELPARPGHRARAVSWAARGRCTHQRTGPRPCACRASRAAFGCAPSTRRAERSRSSVRESRWTAVLQVTAPAYPLADRSTQQRAGVRLGFAAGPARPGGLPAGRDPVARAHHPRLGSRAGGLVAEQGRPRRHRAPVHYEALIAQAGPAATRHETFVAVSIDERRCKRAIRRGRGRAGRHRAGPDERAGLGGGGTTALRRPGRGMARSRGPGAAGPDPVRPAATQSIDNRARPDWRRGSPTRRSRADGRASRLQPLPHRQRLHAVYWIASWPRMQVQAAWLYPLLVLGGVRRTVSVTAEPDRPVPVLP